MQLLKHLCGLVLAATLPAILGAQEQEDENIVRLMSAQSVSNVEKQGKVLRQAEGPARFLHNDTWLICDTAIWDVDAKIIYAYGNVSIEQENTVLRSDKLTYYIDMNLAEFRGNLVELTDKDMNTLRTHNLDYNTKDSVGVFKSGASMKDKDGKIIESLDGTYSSKEKLFTFERNVDMFSDSVFVKTSLLYYNTESEVATFPNYVDAWQQDRMLSGNNGWYDKKAETFFMKGDVHTMDTEKEGWCDTLYFFRSTKTLELTGNAQLTDTTRNVSGLAGLITYQDTLSTVTMQRDPLVIMEMKEKDEEGMERLDSVFIRSDIFKYWKVMLMDVDSATVAEAKGRIKDLSDDPVENIRKQAAEAAAKKRQEILDNDPNVPLEQKSPEAQERILRERNQYNQNKNAGANRLRTEEDDIEEEKMKKEAEDTLAKAPAPAPQDSLGVVDNIGAADTLAVKDSLNVRDSLAVADSLNVKDSVDVKPKRSKADSVEIAFMRARGNIKVFRKTMQMTCDSLEFSQLDSLARLYVDPIVWNDRNHQYNADSIFVRIKDNKMDRANLLSNAFIQIEELSNSFYDQIKSTEMTAFFDDDGQLKRFDAMGGASAIFYLKEKDEIATANKSEAKIMTANFQNGEIRTISYFESPSSTAYPVPQMSKEDKYLKGFGWKGELRPKGKEDLSSRIARTSQRRTYEKKTRPKFKQTDVYFPGYMKGVYREIEIGDSLRRVMAERERERKRQEDSLKLAGQDSLAFAGDSLAVADSLVNISDSLATTLDSLAITLDSLATGLDSLAVKDSLALADSTASQQKDSTAVAAPAKELSPEELKAMEKEQAEAARKAEKEAKRKAAEARRKEAEERREARWKALDEKDAAKKAAKEARRLEKLEKKLRKQLKRFEKEKAREEAMISKYKEKYMQKSL